VWTVAQARNWLLQEEHRGTEAGRAGPTGAQGWRCGRNRSRWTGGSQGSPKFTRAQGPSGATGANGTNLTDSDKRTSTEVKLIVPPT